MSCHVLPWQRVQLFVYPVNLSLGLYDLKTIAPGSFAREATALFEQGMKSLKKLLPLFDMGSTTCYDLRHFTLKLAAPNIARWDYHATHVNQVSCVCVGTSASVSH